MENGSSSSFSNGDSDSMMSSLSSDSMKSLIIKANTENKITTGSVRQTLTYEETIHLLEQKIQHLLTIDAFTTDEVTDELKFVQRQTRYSADTILNRRVVDRIVRAGIAHVYLRAWRSITAIDYLDDDNVCVFSNLQLILSIIWNCTDKSISLCDCLARAMVVNQMLSELAKTSLSQADLNTDPDRLYLVKAYLGILHNMVRLCVDSRRVFRAANAVDVLRKYLCRPQGLVRTKAYLVLSYVVDEKENDVINATNENIAYIVEILRSALKSENHFTQVYAFWASEIVCGLNHLAINDSNKSRLGQLGAIELYTSLLKKGSEEERSLSAAGLWILSFSADNRRIMVNEPGCLEALQKASGNTTEETVCRSARGALWVIRTNPDRPQSSCSGASDSSVDADTPHIMISYQWGSQSVMLAVKERLKAEGYKVWMDVDNMSGSTLEAMALAVERAAVVLVCLSQGYKDSPSCRTEAEYMYRLRKDIIPLVLQPSYSPDGWLGILVGTRLYFDLSCPATFDREVTKLIVEIGDRGRLSDAFHSCSSYSSLSSSSSSVSRNLSESPVIPDRRPMMHNYPSVPQASSASSWSQQDVQTWLCTLKLSGLPSPRFKELDGSLLLQYKKMMLTAPQYFYQSLETNFGLSVVDILQFSKALESLK